MRTGLTPWYNDKSKESEIFHDEDMSRRQIKHKRSTIPMIGEAMDIILEGRNDFDRFRTISTEFFVIPLFMSPFSEYQLLARLRPYVPSIIHVIGL
jgi:hypothetical protein